MRKGPKESATKFKVGFMKLGNDDKYWIVKKNKNGVQRWVRNTKKNNTKKNNTKRNNTKRINAKRSNGLTIEKIKMLKKKYNVSVYGNKIDIINGLWRVRRSSISSEDLELMLPFLQNDYKKEAEIFMKLKNILKKLCRMHQLKSKI